MANKYDYHVAYLNVYEVLTDHAYKVGDHELDGLDEKTRKMALEYLKAGAEKGNKTCKTILGELYIKGKYVEKNEKLGKQLIEEAEK